MLAAVILSRKYFKTYTEGWITLPSGLVLRSIERPWRHNQCNVSCFPEGAYHVKWLERSASGKYKRVWHVQDVPGRCGILFHQGNFVRHSLGCTIVGQSFGSLGGRHAVLSSRSGMNRMRDELGGQDFKLTVEGYVPFCPELSEPENWRKSTVNA